VRLGDDNLMYRKAVIFVLCMGLVATARDAAAQVGQAWTDRGYVNVSAGAETTSGELDGARNFRLYGENGTISVRQGIDSGGLFDIAAGARVWRNLSVGIAYHREGTSGEGTADATVPNPGFTDRPRSVTVNASDLNRTEHAVHLQFGYMVPLNERLSVHLFVGPSFFSLHQDVISDVSFTEGAFPFTSVTATPAIAETSDSGTGYNIGADVAYQLYETTSVKVGLGFFLRYAGATVQVPVLDNSVGSDVGGLQFGFGGRLRF
jgi:hypothetical protein